MSNTKIQYAVQYEPGKERTHATVIPGTMYSEQINRIMGSLNRQNKFDPRKVGIPMPAGAPQFATLQGISQTQEIENLNVDAETLTQRFEACKHRWYTSPDISI